MVVSDGCGLRIVHEPDSEAGVSVHLEGWKGEREEGKEGDEASPGLAACKDFQHNRNYNERPRLAATIVETATAAYKALTDK